MKTWNSLAPTAKRWLQRRWGKVLLLCGFHGRLPVFLFKSFMIDVLTWLTSTLLASIVFEAVIYINIYIFPFDLNSQYSSSSYRGKAYQGTNAGASKYYSTIRLLLVSIARCDRNNTWILFVKSDWYTSILRTKTSRTTNLKIKAAKFDERTPCNVAVFIYFDP